MASPQTENGYTPIAHELLRAFIKAHLSAQQWEALMTIALHTYGQSRKETALSYKQISLEMGRPRTRSIEALKSLVDRGVVRYSVPPGGSTVQRTNQKNVWKIHKDYQQWGGTVERTSTVQRTTPSTVQRTSSRTRANQRNKAVTPTYSADQLTWFENLWNKYPSKIGKKGALKHFLGSVKDKSSAEKCAIALSNYINSKRVIDGFIQNGSTWFNNWHDWVEYSEVNQNKDVF